MKGTDQRYGAGERKQKENSRGEKNNKIDCEKTKKENL